MDHTMGFAAMVEPLTQFLMDARANQTASPFRAPEEISSKSVED